MAACQSPLRARLRWKNLVERHLPLSQPKAHHGNATLEVHAHHTTDLVVARHTDAVAGLELLTHCTQRGSLALLARKVDDFLLVLLALEVGVVLLFQSLLAGQLGLRALLLKLSHFRRSPLPAAQVFLRP